MDAESRRSSTVERALYAERAAVDDVGGGGDGLLHGAFAQGQPPGEDVLSGEARRGGVAFRDKLDEAAAEGCREPAREAPLDGRGSLCRGRP